MPWQILSNLGKQLGPDVDATVWLFQVERESEQRLVEVLIAGPAKLSEIALVRDAVETNGQAALAKVLRENPDGDPPKRITVRSDGIEDSWTSEVRAARVEADGPLGP